MPKMSSRPAVPASGPRLRRGYFESRYGQLHVHNAIPPGGGFDEATPLICLHHAPLTGRVFVPFMALMATDRSVYAPDLPGYGESDRPAERPTIADYAAAIGDFLDTMRLRSVDLLGYHTGSLVAAELAIARPKQVRRVVLAGIPALNEAEREAFRRAPWPVPPAENGSHLATEWTRTLQWRGPRVTLEMAARDFADKLHNGPNASWAAIAVMHYQALDRLALLTQPTLVLRPKDDLWDATQRARTVLPRARFVDLADQGPGVLETAPDVVMKELRPFLAG